MPNVRPMNKMNENPPTYVPIIIPPLIRLAYVTDGIKDKLRHQGLKVTKDKFSYYCIPYDDSEINDLKNISLVETLMKLNDIGVVFGEDYKQLCSPAELMRELQAERILRKKFKSIAFGIKQFGDWIIKENAEQIG
jgi:hypothetical protein